MEPVTFKPSETFARSPHIRGRPASQSVMKRDFPLPAMMTVSHYDIITNHSLPVIARVARGFPYYQARRIAVMGM